MSKAKAKPAKEKSKGKTPPTPAPKPTSEASVVAKEIFTEPAPEPVVAVVEEIPVSAPSPEAETSPAASSKKEKASSAASSKAKLTGSSVEYMFTSEGALAPQLGYPGDAAIDICTPVHISLPPKASVNVDTGIRLKLPTLPDFMKEHFVMSAQVVSKSGLSFDKDIEKGAGLIDANYEGTLKIKLFNHSARTQSVQEGSRIAQIIFVPVMKITALTEVSSMENTSERGSKGFGSQG